MSYRIFKEGVEDTDVEVECELGYEFQPSVADPGMKVVAERIQMPTLSAWPSSSYSRMDLI